MFDQMLDLVKEHLGNNPEVTAAIPPEQADAIHREIATHLNDHAQPQPASEGGFGGLLSSLEGGLGGGNIMTGALAGGLISSLANKFGLSSAVTGAIAGALPGLVQKYLQHTNSAKPGNIPA